ncbi:MAG: hypothetical protein S4CHLAM2_15580 [Chlamydiales bacterium]|nr:hypothetical protein [Chlamydiales bacterium]
MLSSSETLKPFSSAAQSIVPGTLYEHYKGIRYQALAVGRHSETLEEYVVYQALYGEKDVWIRPLGMFLEEVVVNGLSRPRFIRCVNENEAGD